MYTMDISNNQNAFPDSDAQPNKRRRKKSMVWDHFTIEKVNPQCTRAFCNQCKKSFAYVSGSKLAGTSHLKRHIALGICPVARKNQDKGHMSPHTSPVRNNISTNGANIPRKRVRATNSAANTYFDHENSGTTLAKMIIQHDYPLQMVEQTGFLNFVRSLQPQFSINSVSKLQEQIMGIYVRERQKVMELLSRIPGRLNLTVDLCSSNQSLTYVLLTGHFTDHDWKLQRRILNVCVAHFPDSCTSINHAVATCLSDWSTEGKLSTITLDHSYDESAVENLRSLLSIKSPLVLKGQLLINGCYAHTLRSLAQDAIGSMRETIENVRYSVKYVKTSELNEERFTKLRQQLQVPSTKNLLLDDLTKWDTTYQMLVAASELKEVFYCLDTCDPNYRLTPSVEEWGNVATLCSYLKLFYEAANIVTSPWCLTTNYFFDFVWKIHLELLNAALSQDLFVSTLTRPLQEKFSKYWEDCNLVLAIAVVMDPRFKMKCVEFSFKRIYGEEDAEPWIRIVDQGLHELFLDYAMLSLSGPTIDEGNEHMVKTEVPQEDELYSDHDGFLDFDVDVSDIMGETQRSELDQYLEESLLPRAHDFDVLGWWKVNRIKYPTLSKLACDVLAIPLSTEPPQSVFDTRERKIDGYLSSLRPSTIQALICSKDWLRYESTEFPFEIPSENHPLIVKTEV